MAKKSIIHTLKNYILDNNILNKSIKNILNEDMLLSENPDEEKSQKISIPTEFPQKVLYTLGKEQLAFIYNNVLIPYYTSVQSLFKPDKPLQIISFYVYFDRLTTQLISTKRNNIPPQSLKDLQSLIDIHKTINQTIQKESNNIVLNEIDENTEIDEIKTLIAKNMNAIGALFNAVLSPIGAGYKQMLFKIDKQMSMTYYTKMNYYNNLNSLYKESQKLFLQTQFKPIPENYKKIEDKLYGTYIKAKMIDVIDKLKPIIKNEPTIQAIPANIKQSIKNKTQEMQDTFSAYSEIVKGISSVFEEYQSALLAYVSKIDISEAIHGDSINKRELVNILQENDTGIFNQQIEKVSNILIKSIKDQVNKQNLEKSDEDKANLDKEKNPRTAEEFVKYYMGFTKDPEINQYEMELLEIISLSQEYWDKNKNILEKVGDVKNKNSIYKVLKDSVEPQHSFVDLIQKWYAIKHKHEMVLYGADQVTFDNIVDLLDDQNNDDEEGKLKETNELDSFSDTINDSDYGFFSEQNGHDIRWKPNDGTKLLLDYIKSDIFIAYLSRKKKEFFDGLFFNNQFYKNVLYTDNGKDSYKSKDDIINKEDVIHSAKRLGTKIDKNAMDSKSLFKEFIKSYSFDKDDVENLGASSMKALVNTFGKNDIAKGQTKDKDHIGTVSSIGLFLTQVLNKFLEKYGSKVGLSDIASLKEKGDTLATLLLNNTNEKQSEKLTAELSNYIRKIFKLYDGETYEKMKAKKNPGGNYDIQFALASLLNVIKKVLQ